MDPRNYQFLDTVDLLIARKTKISKGPLPRKVSDFSFTSNFSIRQKETHPSPPVIRIDFLAVGVLILLLSIDPRLSETSVDAMNLTGPACP